MGVLFLMLAARAAGVTPSVYWAMSLMAAMMSMRASWLRDTDHLGGSEYVLATNPVFALLDRRFAH